MKHYCKILLTVSILISACNYIPCSSSSDLTKVKEVPEYFKIAGIYKPDDFTQMDIPGYSKSDSIEITLTKDGIIYFRNLPKSTFTNRDYSADTAIKINGIGSWNCSYVKNTANINTKVKLSDTLIFAPSIFNLYKKKGRFVILLKIGDPDVCQAVRLLQQ